MSADGLTESLLEYQVQLVQVDSAISSDPGNEDLLKLRRNLQEVIKLTTELITSVKDTTTVEENEHVVPLSWNRGDWCMAPRAQDGLLCEAVIESITKDGQCTVKFLHFGNTEVISVKLLKTIGKDVPSNIKEASKSKKQIVQAQREYKRKKAQKRAQKMKQLNEANEKEKEKWQSFNSCKRKGHVKKSIFASPDNVKGRVGVGTCGISGRPMTEYHQQEKWRWPQEPS